VRLDRNAVVFARRRKKDAVKKSGNARPLVVSNVVKLRSLQIQLKPIQMMMKNVAPRNTPYAHNAKLAVKRFTRKDWRPKPLRLKLQPNKNV